MLLGPESAVLGLLVSWWAKLGLLVAATVRPFGPMSHSIFFKWTHKPMTRVASAVSDFPRSAPLWAHTSEDLPVLRLGENFRNLNFVENLLSPLEWVWVVIW